MTVFRSTILWQVKPKMVRLVTLFTFISLIIPGFSLGARSEQIRSLETIWSLEPAGTYLLSKNKKDFGGISALIVENHGAEFIALSDKAKYFKGVISRDTKGSISKVSISEPTPILSSKGKPLKNKNLDSEAIIKARDGSYYISFESNNRIMHHKNLNGAGTFLPNHVGFDDFHYSKGIEALAISNEGLIYALPEAPTSDMDSITAYKFNGKEWKKSFKIESLDGYNITDAIFASDNTLLLLERNYSWGGFTTRIRRFRILNDTAELIQTLLESHFRQFDNLEGMSIWLDKKGEYWLTLVSDDNFNIFQVTQLVEFKIKQK